MQLSASLLILWTEAEEDPDLETEKKFIVFVTYFYQFEILTFKKRPRQEQENRTSCFCKQDLNRKEWELAK